jgi:hypothetical protein
MKIRGLRKIFNKYDTPCQGESEFVNHLMAASKSGKSWILAGLGRCTFQGGGKGDEDAGSTN